jgi:hypothetical protein
MSAIRREMLLSANSGSRPMERSFDDSNIPSTNHTSRTRLCRTSGLPAPHHIPPTAGVVPRLGAFAPGPGCGRAVPRRRAFLACTGRYAAPFLRRFRRSASLVQRRRNGHERRHRAEGLEKRDLTAVAIRPHPEGVRHSRASLGTAVGRQGPSALNSRCTLVGEMADRAPDRTHQTEDVSTA